MKILTLSLLVCAVIAGGDACCWYCVPCHAAPCCWTCLACAAQSEVQSNNSTVPNIEDAHRSHVVFSRMPASLDSTCPVNWSKFGHRCFFLDTTKRSWAKAQQFCQTIGGNLASIHSAAEYNHLQQMTPNPTWVGGSDCQEESAWFWTDGTALAYTSWCPEKPDNTKAECCLQINIGVGQCWDDVDCSSMQQSICVMSLK